MKDRRNRPSDRRNQLDTQKFPFRDSHGNLVTHDRRKLPDRRVDNIGIEKIEQDDDADSA